MPSVALPDSDSGCQTASAISANEEARAPGAFKSRVRVDCGESKPLPRQCAALCMQPAGMPVEEGRHGGPHCKRRGRGLRLGVYKRSSASEVRGPGVNWVTSATKMPVMTTRSSCNSSAITGTLAATGSGSLSIVDSYTMSDSLTDGA